MSAHSSWGLAALCAFGALLGACGSGTERPQLVVGAASSLDPLLNELRGAFEEANGVELVYDFSSSGTLAHQIREGAPIDVFASADTRFMEALANDGFIAPDSVAHFADGALVAVASIATPPDPDFLSQDPDVVHVALANPELAPYGAAARYYLEETGQWSDLTPKIVFSENVRQALQYVSSGNAEVGLVPLSLVTPDPPPGVTVIAVLPVSGGLLSQSIGIVSGTENRPEAERFLEFLLTDLLAHQALRRYGYMTPESAGTR